MATAVSRLRTIRANGARFNPQSEAIRKGSGALHWQALFGPSFGCLLGKQTLKGVIPQVRPTPHDTETMCGS